MINASRLIFREKRAVSELTRAGRVRPSLARRTPVRTRLMWCLVLWCLVGASVLGCVEPNTTPRVVDGVLDLSDRDFDVDGTVKLDGDWEVCWNAFVPIESGECPHGDWTLFPVPRLWSDSGIASPIGGKGIASYRVRLELPPDSDRFALRVGSPMTAHRLWINGELRGGVGDVGTTAESTVPKLANRDYALPTGDSTIEILVHVANFDFRGGGLRRPWHIGPWDQIQARNAYELIRYTAFATMSFALGLLFLAQFALRPMETPRAWLGLFAILVGLRMIPGATSDLYQLVLGWASFGALIRLEYLDTALLIYTAGGYLRSKLPSAMPPRLTRLIQLASLALVPIHLLAPLSIVLATIPAILVLPIALLILSTLASGSGYRKQIPGAGLTFTAGLITSVGVVHDVVRTTMGWGASIELFPYFVVAWLAMESASVLRSYAHVYSRIERLSNELQEANVELRDTEQAIVRFVPFDFLRSLGKQTIREVHAGDSAITEMTVMHCGFHTHTSTSAEVTHELADRLAPCIHRHDGFLNDYRGDGLQALFQSRPNDALAAAMEILSETRALNRAATSNGRPAVEVRIGIATGSVWLGVIGSRDHLVRSIVGEAIERARQIETATTRVDTRVLIDQTTRQGLEEACRYEIRALDGVEIESEAGTASVYEVVEEEGKAD